MFVNNFFLFLYLCFLLFTEFVNIFYHFDNYEVVIGYYLKNVILNCGPIAIKIFQCLSSRNDIFHDTIRSILSSLTDNWRCKLCSVCRQSVRKCQTRPTSKDALCKAFVQELKRQHLGKPCACGCGLVPGPDGDGAKLYSIGNLVTNTMSPKTAIPLIKAETSKCRLMHCHCHKIQDTDTGRGAVGSKSKL